MDTVTHDWRLELYTHCGIESGEVRWQHAHIEPEEGDTPRADAMFGNGSAVELQKLLENAKELWHSKLMVVVPTATVFYGATSTLPRLHKLESFLDIIEDQRARRLFRHPNLSVQHIFDENAMTDIRDLWMRDHTRWMKA